VFAFHSTFDLIQTTTGLFFELVLFYFAFRRRLIGKLTFFFIYIILLFPKDLLWTWIAHTPRINDPFWAYCYWGSDFIFCFIRVLVVCEIYWRVLRRYPTIWMFTWRIIVGILGTLFLWTGLTGWRHSSVFRELVTLGFQRMELLQTILILVILGIGVYYRVQIGSFFRSILAGICIYSAFQVVVFQVGTIKNDTANLIFGYAHLLTYLVAVLVWDWALWRMSPAPEQSPAMISQEMYDEMSPHVHDRLRALNDRLAELWRRPHK
jgi:hypothetical protein